MIQAYLKGKLVMQENCIKKNEDFKTSSSIGLLQYLPDDLFWKIFQNSCTDFQANEFGKIKSFQFWPHTDATNTTNNQFIEPDVWIETDNCDIIIEAKLRNDGGQDISQWKNEITSIRNEQRNNDHEKNIVLIALGGNENMKRVTVLKCTVYKTSWFHLLNAIANIRKDQGNNNYICRILDDAIEMFARQGVMKIEWFETLPSNQSINEKIIQEWKPIN